MSKKKDPTLNPVPQTAMILTPLQQRLTQAEAAKLAKLLLPDYSGGLPIMDINGLPVVVFRGDLRPGEVSFVVR